MAPGKVPTFLHAQADLGMAATFYVLRLIFFDRSGKCCYGYPMHMSLWLKIRITLILAAGVVLFAIGGWPYIKPAYPGGALTIILHQQPGTVVLTLVILTGLATGLAIVIGWGYAGELGILAVPAGLAALGLMTGSMNELFVRWYDLSARSGLFYRMMADTVIWSAAIFLAYFLTMLAAGRAKKESSGEPDRATSIGAAKARRRSKKEVKILNSPVFRQVASVVLACLIALILLRLLGQSGRAWTNNREPVYTATVLRSGQVVFATFAAFWLATLAGHQLFNGSLVVFLLGPPIVAIMGYLMAAMQPLSDVAPVFVPFSAASGTILPLQYIGFGSLAVIAGYWHSVKIRRIRRA